MWALDPEWAIDEWAMSLENVIKTKYGEECFAPFKMLREEAARAAAEFASSHLGQLQIGEYPLCAHYLRQNSETARFTQHVDSNITNGHPQALVTVVCKLSHGRAAGLGVWQCGCDPSSYQFCNICSEDKDARVQMGEDGARNGMRYSGKYYSYVPYPFRPSMLVFNSQRAHETRILKVGGLDDCEKLTFFFGPKGVNPYDKLHDFLTMEDLANENAEEKLAREPKGEEKKRKRGRADAAAASNLINLSQQGKKNKKNKKHKKHKKMK